MTQRDTSDGAPPDPFQQGGERPFDPFDTPTDDGPQALSRRGRAAVLARIHALMEYWGITVEDLEAHEADAPALTPPAPLPVKYRHPVTGDTWDGQGPHPDWLRKALLQEGLRVEELKPGADTPDRAPDPA